jgi:hypothetical protein
MDAVTLGWNLPPEKSENEQGGDPTLEGAFSGRVDPTAFTPVRAKLNLLAAADLAGFGGDLALQRPG